MDRYETCHSSHLKESLLYSVASAVSTPTATAAVSKLGISSSSCSKTRTRVHSFISVCSINSGLSTARCSCLTEWRMIHVVGGGDPLALASFLFLSYICPSVFGFK